VEVRGTGIRSDGFAAEVLPRRVMTGLIPVEYSSLRVDRSSWRCRSWTSGRPSRRTGKWGRLQTL
jgi:hypothetical protein